MRLDLITQLFDARTIYLPIELLKRYGDEISDLLNTIPMDEYLSHYNNKNENRIADIILADKENQTHTHIL